MRRIKLILAVVALLVMLTSMGAAPAMADRSHNNNNRSKVSIHQRCSSGDIEIEGNDGDTRFEFNSRGCKHGKKHHKHLRHHHRH